MINSDNMVKLTLDRAEDNFYKQVFKDYGKTKKDLEEYVDILLKWCQAQPHFPEIPSMNGLTLSVLACKFSLEKAKQKLDTYYTVRRLIPEIFTSHPLSPEMIKQSKVVYFIPLPKPTADHQRVIYIQINPEYGPDDFNHELLIIQLTQVIEMIIQEDTCYNFHTIFNCDTMKLGHISKLSPMVFKKLALCLEKVYANRVASFYMVNFYPFMENFINTLFKPLLPSKLRGRVKVYDNADILLEHFDKSILPKDIGGEERSLKELHAMLLEKYEELKPRFDALQYMTVDESLRPTKLENDDILGYYGSFKQLNVD